MMCFVELFCLVLGIALGIILLAQGSFPIGAKKELRGAPGFITAGLLIAVFPLALLIGCGVGGFMAHQNKDVDVDDPMLMLIDVGVVALCGIPAILVAFLGAKPKKKKKKKRKRPLDDGYDDYDRADDDYDRPRRRRRDEEEDDDPRPLRHPLEDRDDEEDDEENSRPRRRRFDGDGGGSNSGRHRPRRRRDEDDD